MDQQTIHRAGWWLPDGLLAAPFLLVGLLGTGPAADNQPDTSRQPDLLAYLLVVVAALSVAAWRRAPVAGLAVATAAIAVYLGLGYPYGPILMTFPVLAGAVAAKLALERAAFAVGAAFVVVLTASAIRIAVADDPQDWGDLLSIALVWSAVVAAAVAIGTAVRVRRQASARVRAEQAARVVSEEQLRMAQELHDAVGHGLAVIAMQSGVALHVIDDDPDQVRASLEAIRVTSRDALQSLRDELARLRTPDESAARAPAPGLADIEVAASRINTAGDVQVSVEVAADPATVPAAVGTAAYRIVQEALTNVVRHAHARTAHVAVRLDGSAVLVEVTDTGRGGVAEGGTGIDGMRRRAESLGGTLVAGTPPGGGFRVSAWLPLTTAAAR
ncbi:MAG: sensor histidine kinase [Candidatus Nanopelagicales bacterium]